MGRIAIPLAIEEENLSRLREGDGVPVKGFLKLEMTPDKFYRLHVEGSQKGGNPFVQVDGPLD